LTVGTDCSDQARPTMRPRILAVRCDGAAGSPMSMGKSKSRSTEEHMAQLQRQHRGARSGWRRVHERDARHGVWAAQLPKGTADLWDVLSGLDGDSRQALFAHCVGLTINAACQPYDRRPKAITRRRRRRVQRPQTIPARVLIASRHRAPDETLPAGGSAGAGTVCRPCPRPLKADALPPERYNLSPRLRRGLFFCRRSAAASAYAPQLASRATMLGPLVGLLHNRPNGQGER
jgi:hypothetical protein